MAAILDEAGGQLLDEGSGVISDETPVAPPGGTIPASSSPVPVFLIMNL